MIDNFNLKVCPYVESYASTADRCKILTYGSVYTNNLYASCPKTGQHNADSCLHFSELRRSMLKDKGDGSDVVGKCIWTGHILDPHLTSVSNTLFHAIVFTCRNVTRYSSISGRYSNISDDEVLLMRKIEIIHETAHLLGAKDGYCYNDNGSEHCTNDYCFSCNNGTTETPNCVMIKTVNLNNSTNVFCDDCKDTIKKYLNENY